MQSSFRSYRYGQVLSGIESNPRLFLYLLIAAIALIFAYQFAVQVTMEWVKAAVGFVGLLAVAAVLVWPYEAIFFYLILGGSMSHFGRGETILGLGSALIYPADVFLAAFMVVEFFRGCLRQTHIYCSTDRWMVAYLGWVFLSVVRGVPAYGYSAVGEAREFLHVLVYFVTIHHITRAEQIPSVLKWLKWSCWVVGLVWFYRLVAGGFMPRSTGGFNLLALSFVAITLAVLLGRDHLKKHRKLAAFVVMFILASIPLNLGRMQIVDTVFIIPFLVWICRRYFFQTMALGVLIGLMMAGFIAWLSSQVGSEVGSIFVKKWAGIINPASDPTGAWRLYSFQWEMEKVFSNPFWVLIGQSFGGYYEWYFSLIDEPIRTAPHSVYVVIWSKMGLIGLLFHLTVFASFFRQGFTFLHRTTDRMQQSIMIILMLCVFETVIHQLGAGMPLYAWVLMGIGTSLARLWTQQAKAPSISHSIVSPLHRASTGSELYQPALSRTARSRGSA